MSYDPDNSPEIIPLPFDPVSFTGREKFTVIGAGAPGAKARGLVDIGRCLQNDICPEFTPRIHVEIPRSTVIATDIFDRFIEENALLDVARSGAGDDRVALAFQQAVLPSPLASDLRAYLARVGTPLAVRSSSLLEDALFEPFAGVYETKMIPNDQPQLEARFQTLAGAIKSVYASVFFKSARSYLRAAGRRPREEKMAVLIQEVVGTGRNNRFYPHLSGVARSCNFYPIGLARPEDGVASLALGLGKMIVEDGVAWSFSPACPQANPPYNTLRELLKQSQTEFWAIAMAEPEGPETLQKTDFLKRYVLADAEKDGTLSFVASTYDAEDDRIVMGVGRPGPRILDFAPILKSGSIPLNALLKKLLRACESRMGTLAEIEFAVVFPRDRSDPARFGFLQARPMVVSKSRVEVAAEELRQPHVLAATEAALGNGSITSVCDIVYLNPERFDIRESPRIATELEALNDRLAATDSPYVLIGFGRWGTSDPSAGVPVRFGQISGARVIVEAPLSHIQSMPSQGSHFFHNLTSFKVLYFSMSPTGKYGVDWAWLGRQQCIAETGFVRHVRSASPLRIKVDGRTGRGVITYEQREQQ